MPDLYENTRPGYLADFVGQNASFSYQEKQKLLEQLHPVRRLEQASVYLAKELDILNLENEISEKVQQRVDKNQREYYLREQLHAIHEELGDGDADETGDDYSRRIRALRLPEETEEKLLGECRRLLKAAVHLAGGGAAAQLSRFCAGAAVEQAHAGAAECSRRRAHSRRRPFWAG